MTEDMHAGLAARAEDQMYSVYNLTPNMWEEPWVTHLLGDLPISRYEVRDLGRLRQQLHVNAGSPYSSSLCYRAHFVRRAEEYGEC